MHERFISRGLRFGGPLGQNGKRRSQPTARNRARAEISLGDWLDFFAGELVWLTLAAGGLAFFCYVASGSYLMNL